MDCITSVLSSSNALPAYTWSPKSKVPVEHPFSHFTVVITCQMGQNDLISPLGCHRQKAQGLGRTVVSYEKVEAVPTSPAHPAKVTGKHKAGDTAHVHGCKQVRNQTQVSSLHERAINKSPLKSWDRYIRTAQVYIWNWQYEAAAQPERFTSRTQCKVLGR